MLENCLCSFVCLFVCLFVCSLAIRSDSALQRCQVEILARFSKILEGSRRLLKILKDSRRLRALH